ncbi:hypothetical protein ACTFIR_003915 [Dictyostelium discoideum]
MEGIKNLPSMVKQGYYMVKLDIKKAYLHVLVDPQYRDLFRFVWKGSHYSWKTMPFGLSFPIPQDVKSEISHWLTVLNQWNGKEISLFPSYDYVLTTDASESGAGATLKKGNKTIKTWSFQWSTTQSNMSSNRWSDTGPISSVRTTLETMPQEESELDWRAYSRILQCKSRPPQLSFRDESQIVVQSNQELQLATEEGSVQSHPTSVRSNPDGSVRISPEQSE